MHAAYFKDQVDPVVLRMSEHEYNTLFAEADKIRSRVLPGIALVWAALLQIRRLIP